MIVRWYSVTQGLHVGSPKQLTCLPSGSSDYFSCLSDPADCSAISAIIHQLGLWPTKHASMLPNHGPPQPTCSGAAAPGATAVTLILLATQLLALQAYSQLPLHSSLSLQTYLDQVYADKVSERGWPDYSTWLSYTPHARTRAAYSLDPAPRPPHPTPYAYAPNPKTVWVPPAPPPVESHTAGHEERGRNRKHGGHDAVVGALQALGPLGSWIPSLADVHSCSSYQSKPAGT